MHYDKTEKKGLSCHFKVICRNWAWELDKPVTEFTCVNTQPQMLLFRRITCTCKYSINSSILSCPEWKPPETPKGGTLKYWQWLLFTGKALIFFINIIRYVYTNIFNVFSWKFHLIYDLKHSIVPSEICWLDNEAPSENKRMVSRPLLPSIPVNLQQWILDHH